MLALVLLRINQHTKFEMTCITNSKNIMGAKFRGSISSQAST